MIYFVRTLDDDNKTIVEYIDKKARSWNILHCYIRLLKDYRSYVSDKLIEIFGNAKMGDLLHGSDVLSPVHFTADDRAGGGLLSTVRFTVFVANLLTLPVAAPYLSAIYSLIFVQTS